MLLTAHGGDAFAFRGGIGGLLKRLMLSRCEHWTANTRATADALGSGVAGRPTFVPMGVEVRRFAAERAERHRRDLKPDQRVVLFVGRLVEKKGVSDLISAFARLPTDVAATAQLWIVGDGFLRSHLEKQSRDLGIADQVRFWGVMNNAELPDVYASADVFAAPSVEAESGDTEGQGVVLLEAFAAGVPVVATRVGGIPEVVEDGKTGLLVAPQSVDALQSSITRLLTERETRENLTRAARRKVEADYDWRVIAVRFTDLYGQLANPPPLPADAPPAAESIAKPPH